MTRLKQKAEKFHQKHIEKHRQNREVTRKIDRMMVFIGTMGPISTFFQVIHIFQVKNVGGITVYTWLGYMTVSVCWFMYGFFYKDKPLMLVNSLSFMVNSFIVLGFVLIYA